MNIRKNIDYSAMFAAMDTAMATGMSQMELYCQLGALVCDRPEKGAAVAAAEYLKNRYRMLPASLPATCVGCGTSTGCMVGNRNC